MQEAVDNTGYYAPSNPEIEEASRLLHYIATGYDPLFNSLATFPLI